MITVDRSELILHVRDTLAKSGFYISEEWNSPTLCFDIIARRDASLLIIKILANVDAFNKSEANVLKILGKFLEGAPLLIGARASGKKKLKRDVVYTRHGVPIMSGTTLFNFLIEGVPPIIYSAPGGFYVKLDGTKLRETREARSISLGTLADVAGVSRKAIQLYEAGVMNPAVDVAIKLEEYLDVPLTEAIDPFSQDLEIQESLFDFDDLDEPQKNVFGQLKDIGYEIIPINKCHFDALTQDSRVLILTGVEKHSRYLKNKARAMTNISKITERYSVVFIDKAHLSKNNIEGTPIIGSKELLKIEDSEDILELIQERSG